jgi:hypothetical protein
MNTVRIERRALKLGQAQVREVRLKMALNQGLKRIGAKQLNAYVRC